MKHRFLTVSYTHLDVYKRQDKELLDEALAVAAKSDVIVAALGESSEMSGESSHNNIRFGDVYKRHAYAAQSGLDAGTRLSEYSRDRFVECYRQLQFPGV